MTNSSDQSGASRSRAPMWIALGIAAVLVIGGVIIAGYAGYRRWVEFDGIVPQPPPPSQKVENAPGPDNSIKEMPKENSATPAASPRAP